MTATYRDAQQGDYPAHFEPPHGPTWKLFFGSGLVRGGWMAGAGFLFGMLLVLALRFWWSWHPVWDTEIVLAIAGMVAMPIGFLAGIG